MRVLEGINVGYIRQDSVPINYGHSQLVHIFHLNLKVSYLKEIYTHLLVLGESEKVTVAENLVMYVRNHDLSCQCCEPLSCDHHRSLHRYCTVDT